MKVRNYSFKKSKRLPADKMTEMNGIKIPSIPGSCYHAIICALVESKDRFVNWSRIYQRTEKYMRQYGGNEAWEQFKNKKHVKDYRQRIKDNTHALTRSGTNCYGYRLHEYGMVIYFFKDGAILFTGGELKHTGNTYNVYFDDGKSLQVRYRGTTMTFHEYKRFLAAKVISASGEIIDLEGLHSIRNQSVNKNAADVENNHDQYAKVLIILDESYSQETAYRLETMGLVVECSDQNEIGGTIPRDQIDNLISDEDVLDVIIDTDVQETCKSTYELSDC